jgi:hypothetical protein
MSGVLPEFFSLVVSGKGVDDLIEAALHDQIELVEGESDAVVGDAVLGEVVGANFLAAVAGADHAAAFGSDLGLLLSSSSS